jgi:actin-related protein 6
VKVKEEVCFVSTAFESDLTKCYKLMGQMIIPFSYSHRLPDPPSTAATALVSTTSHPQASSSNPKETEDMEVVLERAEEEGNVTDEEDEEVEYLRKFFVMPDFHRILKGYVKEEGEAFAADEQVLTMESERFTIPEVLFRPTDIGMNQAGIVETIGQSISCLHEVCLPLSLLLFSPDDIPLCGDQLEVGLCVKNIILTGGNSLFPNYRTRIHSEVFQFIPDQWTNDVKVLPSLSSLFQLLPLAAQVFLPADPINYAWQGASRFVRDELSAGTIQRHFVSRQEYHEKGDAICFQKFNSPPSLPS